MTVKSSPALVSTGKEARVVTLGTKTDKGRVPDDDPNLLSPEQ